MSGSVDTGAVNVPRLYRVTDEAEVIGHYTDLAEAEQAADGYGQREVSGDVVITEYAQAHAVGLLMQALESELWAIAEHAVEAGCAPWLLELPTVAAAVRYIREMGLEVYRAQKGEGAHG